MDDFKQKILDATHGGLDVILRYYPSAQKAVENKNEKFKVRESERTASSSIKEYKGMWFVTDFGDDSKGRNCFDIVMKEENCNFTQALHKIADMFGVSIRLDKKVNVSHITSRPATSDEPDGTFTYKAKDVPSKRDLDCLGKFVNEETLKKYSYYSLISYNTTSKGVTYTITSSDDFPIFLRSIQTEEGEFCKIYKPYEFEKSRRFYSHGKRPKDLVNGLAEAKKRYDELMSKAASEEDYEEETKLPEIVICSGERDALNIAGMGYYPIWLNSETAELTEHTWSKLTRMAERIYNIPDLDDTGIKQGYKLSLKYLSLYTIELPQWLRTYKDYRGRPRKDFRDYCEFLEDKSQFRDLMKMSPTAQFWRYEINDKGTRLQINLTSLLYYLRCNGFYKFMDDKTKVVHFVKKERYIVEEYTPLQIRDFIREDMRKRLVDPAVQEAFIRSKATTAALFNDLDTTTIDFTKMTDKTRTFYFDNCAAVVSADDIKITNNADIETQCWKNEIIPHNFKRLEPSFKIEGDLNGTYGLRITNDKSHYFRMLINASRMYWRQELEERATNDPEENKRYAEANKFNIQGERLTDAELAEQVQHLLNKIYAIGYLLHRYKYASRAYALWVMENRLTDENTSAGGSGKSLFIKTLKSLNLLNIATFQGRDTRLTENKHLLDRVNSETDLITIDDAAKNFDFNFFYTMITGDMSVNPKGDKSFEIDYKDAPNFAFTSNFPPPIVGDNSSTTRRILYVVFSDYYHQNINDQYKETRKVADDFGMDLFDVDYTEEMYNEDINFCIDCLQFYLNSIEIGIPRYDPPMENVRKRIHIADMGVMFKDWAEVYFAKDSDKLDVLISKQEAFNDFISETGARNITSQRFKEKLRSFIANSDYLEQLNPPELLKDGSRILKKINNKTVECIYLKSIDKDVPSSPKIYNEPII